MSAQNPHDASGMTAQPVWYPPPAGAPAPPPEHYPARPMFVGTPASASAVPSAVDPQIRLRRSLDVMRPLVVFAGVAQLAVLLTRALGLSGVLYLAVIVVAIVAVAGVELWVRRS